MPNFSIALTGLQADTVALNTIGNNLSNLNTTAFKSQSTTFEDLFYQNIGTTGSGNGLQIGVGTRVSGTNSDFTQGSVTTTQKATDMALGGNGFFLVQQGNIQSLTRAGDFQTDSAGKLITTEGQSVMGYGVVNGAISLTAGTVPIQIPVGATQPAQATSNVSLTTSLNSDSPNNASFPTSIPVFDSLGARHTATVTYTKASTSTWNWTMTLPPGDTNGTAPINNSGQLTFNQAGQLTNPTTNYTGIKFGGLSDGASDLNLNFNIYDKTGAAQILQTSGTSTTTAIDQDGYASGSYQSFSVDGNGVIAAQFSNGHTSTVGQVAIATVTNTDGLTRAGSNNYAITAASGLATLGVANQGGRGVIEGESLEASNVDISAEFSDLIVAQRAFEANSKTVSTFDSVTENAINMIR